MRSPAWLVALTTIACSATPPPTSGGPSAEPAPPPAPSGPVVMRSVTSHGGGISCLDALVKHEQDHGPDAAPADVEVEDAIKRQLNEGTYLNSCGVATSASVDICAAIVDGQVLGVTVELDPGLQREADCVAEAIMRLGFPSSTALVEAHTSFEPSLN